MMFKNIAVLMTCHNRCEKTIVCLKSLYEQKLSNNFSLDVYLVDDGSIDGTEQSVRFNFPKIKIIKGNGNLFWCGGMRLAWSEAAKSDYSAYLWLNDDTILFPEAIESLIETASNLKKKETNDSIIVGNFKDPTTGMTSYGGRMLKKTKIIEPSEFPQECEKMNGNMVLISANIFKCIGNLSSEFRHNSGDNDYSLRAIKNGFKVWIAPGFQGYCAINEDNNQWSDFNITLRKRLKILHSPKGQPFYETFLFAKRHKGILWPLDLIKLYSLVLFPRTYKRVKHILKID